MVSLGTRPATSALGVRSGRRGSGFHRVRPQVGRTAVSDPQDDASQCRGKSFKTVSLKVVDVEAHRSLYESPKISYLRREQSLTDPLYEDPIPRVTNELEEILAQQLQPQDMPDQLRPEHAARRVLQLSRRTGSDCPLGVLSEMRFYQRQGLISLQQLLAGYQAVLGEAAGLSLLAGGPAAQQETISAWLPTLRLPEPARQSDPDDN